MARKKTAAGMVAGEKKLRPEALQSLWKKVPVQEWYRLLQKENREGAWVVNGHSIKGRCPYHDDSTPSFVLNFDRGIGKCFGSCGKVVTDLVQLFARLTRSSYMAAMTMLCTELHIENIIGPGIDELAEFNALQEMKKSAALAMREVITEYVRERPAHLDYIRPALEYLEYGRKIPIGTLDQLPLGIFAKPEHLKKHIPEEHHALFDEYFSKVSNPSFWGAPCFHYNTLPGTISRFKLRKMRNDALELSSGYADGSEIPYDLVRSFAEKSFCVVDDPFIKEMGVFGLHHYNRMIGNVDANAYVTEGEFDALAVMVAQIHESRSDFMIFAFGGNGNSGLSFLRELGIRTLWVVQDSPAKHGDDVVRRLLLNGRNFIGDSVNRALSFRIFSWPAEMLGGDLDEAVQLMGYPAVCDYICQDRKERFLLSYPWAVSKCDAEIADLRQQAENSLRLLGDSPEDVVQKENIRSTLTENVASVVRNWFGCIHSQLDKLTFIQRYSASEGLDFAQLNEVRRELYDLDTTQGAVNRLMDSLREYVDIAYYEPTRSGNNYTLWSKNRHETACIPMGSDSGIELVLSQYLEKPMMAWAKQLLGDSPVLLEKSSGNDLIDSRNIQKNVTFLVRQGLLGLLQSTRPRNQLRDVGQGIHYVDIPQARAEGCVYFVNGNKAFRGTVQPASGAQIEWESIGSIVSGDLWFNLDADARWSAIDDVSELYACTQVDLKGLFDKLLTILDGWAFRNHDVMREYLAAWILSLPVQRAMGMVNMTYLTGESTSGKTSFLRGLLGGYRSASYDVPPIVESAVYTSDATPAWIYQTMDQSALLLGIDEAEIRQNDAHSQRVEDIHKMLYPVPTGGAHTNRGAAAAGQSSDYFVQVPVILAAISMPSDPVFLTRTVMVHTVKDLHRRNLGDYITSIFDERDLAQIRSEITLGLLPHLPELTRRLPALRLRLSKVTGAVETSVRYINNLLPALTVYDFLGLDAEDLYKRMVGANKMLIETVNTATLTNELMDNILYTRVIKTSLDDSIQDYVSPSKLIMTGEYSLLNNADCGVYVLAERQWIVLIWRLVLNQVLPRSSSRHRFKTEDALKAIIAQNPYVLQDVTDEDHDYIIAALRRSDIKTRAGYSVVRMEYLVTAEEARRARRAQSRRRNEEALEERREPVIQPEIPIEAYEEEATSFSL